MDYWKECILEAFEDAGIDATDEQKDTVISWVEGAHENFSLGTGRDCIPNPLAGELGRVERELQIERDKVICKECNGKGHIVSHGPCHSYHSDCSRCRGEGRHSL